MVKAGDNVYVEENGKAVIKYKFGDELPDDLAWYLQLNSPNLLDTYEEVNGSWRLKSGAKEFIHPNRLKPRAIKIETKEIKKKKK